MGEFEVKQQKQPLNFHKMLCIKTSIYIQNTLWNSNLSVQKPELSIIQAPEQSIIEALEQSIIQAPEHSIIQAPEKSIIQAPQHSIIQEL